MNGRLQNPTSVHMRSTSVSVITKQCVVVANYLTSTATYVDYSMRLTVIKQYILYTAGVASGVNEKGGICTYTDNQKIIPPYREYSTDDIRTTRKEHSTRGQIYQECGSFV